MLNILSVDVEDYFMVSAFSHLIPFTQWGRYECRVERNTIRLLELFGRKSTKATFFILGWVAERYPQLIKEIHGRGHEVGSHGYNHRLVYEMTPQEFREDIRKTKHILEDITGKPIVSYRAPSYSITEKSFWALDILMEEGFRFDSSIYPIRHDRYGFPAYSRSTAEERRGDLSLMEVPLSTIRLFGMNIPFGGGGYFRLYPYRFTTWCIDHLNNSENLPIVAYIHPWEIDCEQPKVRAKCLTRLRHGINIRKNERRLEALLDRYRFGSMAEVVGCMDIGKGCRC